MPLVPRNAREIRVSVTGLGKMGTFHVKALRQLAGGESESYYKAGLREQVGKVRICGLCDLDPAKLGAFAGIPVFRDHATMLREVHPDIAIIATPSGSHYELAMCALQAGAHVLVEKPATTRAVEWAALVETAERLDLRIMAGHVERYNPVAIKLHALLAENALHVADYAFTRCQPHDPRIPDDIVADKLIHDLDLAMFLFGPVATHTLVDFKKVGKQTRELTLRLTHRHGITGELFVSWLRGDGGRFRECRLRTVEGGEARGDFVAKRLFIDAVPLECAVTDWVKPDNNQIKDELADFVGYCLVPDPALPAIQPLLSPAEVGAATAITEQVAREIEKMDLPVRAGEGGNRMGTAPVFKIGVMVESFRNGLRGGLEAAAALGVQGVQFYATNGETHFERLRGPALGEFKAMLRDMNLEVSAVCGDFGGHGFECEAGNRERIENTKRVIDLALELGCSVVTTHIGVIPSGLDHPRRGILANACRELGAYAHAQGAVLAIETGPEPAAVLGAFISQLGLPGGTGVNFDPANLVMVCCEDIPAAVQTLAPHIVHTHAKDGLNLRPVDAEKLYGSFAGDHAPSFDPADYIRETPLGNGAVPFPAYLSALRAAGYTGYLTVERECGEQPHQDIATAVQFLSTLIARHA